MSIHVEFFGIVRRRAACAAATVDVDDPTTLGDVIAQLSKRFPLLAGECLDGRALRQGYLANLGGEHFVSDPDTAIRCGATLLIMSADAGG